MSLLNDLRPGSWRNSNSRQDINNCSFLVLCSEYLKHHRELDRLRSSMIRVLGSERIDQARLLITCLAVSLVIYNDLTAGV